MVVWFKLAVQEQLESHVWLISGSLIILIVAVTLAVLILTDKLDTGFSGKTLWDLIEKLGVPVLVVVIGGGLALSAQRAGRRTEDEHERTTERAREATLREYLDRISDLILNHDLICTSGGFVCQGSCTGTVARCSSRPEWSSQRNTSEILVWVPTHQDRKSNHLVERRRPQRRRPEQWGTNRLQPQRREPYPESTEGRPWGQSLKKPSGAPLNLG